MRALLLAALVACASPSRPSTPAPSPLAARLDAVIDKAVARDIVGVVVIVAQGGNIIYQRAAGFEDREARTKTQLGTLFRLASMTKPIVSITALAMIDDNKLSLEDPITNYLPQFSPKLADGRTPVITVRHLLTHTSGLGYRFLDGGAYATANVSDGLAEPGMSMDENLRRLATVPLLFEPGTSWSYGLSIDVLGAVLEKAGGAPLPALVARYVTAKLGTDSPHFMASDAHVREETGGLAVPYVAGTPPERMREPHPVPLGDGITLTMSPARALDAASYPSGGAGAVGTARNYLFFLEALRKGGAPLLAPATARMAMSNQIGDIASPFLGKSRFGFGFGIDAGEGKRGAGSLGWGGVYGTGFWIDPAAKLSVVILTNVAGDTPLENDITNALYAR